MMGREGPPQGKLFHIGVSLDRRVRENHPLRRIRELVDFDFVYAAVADKYGVKGNTSVPPPVVLKLMLLLVLYNVRSERELMDTVPERLDWLWFLGFDLDDDVPHHSVLSKARRRWGVEVFRRFFSRVVGQCVEAGLVDGSKIFVDSSLVQADASVESTVDRSSLTDQLTRKYDLLEQRLEDAPSARVPGPEAKRTRHIYSATDPDAALVRRAGTTRYRYQTHQAVSEGSGVVTATTVTPGDVNEAHLLMDLVEQHEQTTGGQTKTVVADSKYGTTENYLTCTDTGITPHIPPVHDGTKKRLRKRGLLPSESFTYDEERDVYVCPQGKDLKRKTFHKNRQSIDYAAAKGTCQACPIRSSCTTNKMGRTVTRHLRHAELDAARGRARSDPGRRDLRRRQHLIEGVFANQLRFGYKRARWRRLWRTEIQNLLCCVAHNLGKLIAARPTPTTALEAALRGEIVHFRKVCTNRRANWQVSAFAVQSAEMTTS